MRFNNLIIGCLVALVMMVVSATTQADMSKEAIAERLAPVGDVCLAGEDCGTAAQASSGSSGSQSGEDIYGSVCAACHDSGAAGAPARDDADAWAERAEKGIDTLYDNAIGGIGAMPAKGGNSDLSDDDVKRAVNYMVENHMDDLPEIGGAEEADSEGETASEETDSGSADDQDTSSDDEGSASAGEGEGNSNDGESSSNDASQSDESSSDGGSDIDGEAIYADVCAACHDSGAAGAPLLGDADDWGDRLDQDTTTLYDHAINGVGAMPPKGGNTSLSDAEVEAAVDYMIEETE
ncbi:c-type cytochrome [Aidingimonas lacisalsi]|uniref:c-type cytochrome n=1 Tax=Aidingimonas lacisalsi TaxID=2604086 RepID=UPI001EFF8F57|nr:c-type cytochrome [Aidingimonas lacisalsi]